MSIADGISGTVDDLIIDGTYEANKTGMPIDLLIVDLTEEIDGETPDSGTI